MVAALSEGKWYFTRPMTTVLSHLGRLGSTFLGGHNLHLLKMELKHDLQSPASDISQGGGGNGQRPGLNRPGKGWGVEGSLQDNIQVGGLKCCIWLQLSLHTLKKLRPGFDLRPTELNHRSLPQGQKQRSSGWTVQCAMGSPR